ncbi:MAG: hypothetical protein LBT10_08070 [Methanobrevibacter sp.]|jgi:hypothetical protein|nr:hypothetical protein [Methanobrevibacter sp.]
MITHIDFVKECSNKINEASSDLNEAVIAADKEWHINHNNTDTLNFMNSNPLDSNPLSFNLLNSNFMSFNSVSSNPLSSGYDEDAYPNALHIYNELKKLGQNVTIANSFDDTGKSNLMLGDLVQYRINSSNMNKPMYKYFLIKNDTGDRYGIDTVDLIPRNANGDKVEKSGEDIAAIHVFQHDRIYIPKSAITADNSKYTLHVNVTGEWRVNELYTAYDTDCTQLNDRLNNIPPMPDTKDQTSGISQICFGIGDIGGGIVALSAGIISLCAASAATAATAGVAAPSMIPGIALIITGLSLIVTGIGLIVSGSFAVEEYNYNRKLYKDGEKNIFDDIQKHNQNPYSISI